MITIVYGSPCSGKTTYVKEHAGANDLIVDVDFIYSAISGRNPHDINLAQYAVATDLREILYDIIRDRKGRWADAWIISTASTDSQLQRLIDRVNADNVVLIDTPKEICLERAAERPTNFERHVERWFTAQNKGDIQCLKQHQA